MFFLSGVAKFLFVPLAEAVVFAMLASYVLSRTLVPTLAMYLLRRISITGRASLQSVRAVAAGFRPGFGGCALNYSAAAGHLLRTGAFFRAGIPAGCACAFFCIRGWARTSFRQRHRAVRCTSAPARERASRRPRASATGWMQSIRAQESRQENWTAWWTTSGCRTAQSTLSYSNSARSARRTATSSCRSKGPPPDRGIRGMLRPR